MDNLERIKSAVRALEKELRAADPAKVQGDPRQLADLERSLRDSFEQAIKRHAEMTTNRLEGAKREMIEMGRRVQVAAAQAQTNDSKVEEIGERVEKIEAIVLELRDELVRPIGDPMRRKPLFSQLDDMERETTASQIYAQWTKNGLKRTGDQLVDMQIKLKQLVDAIDKPQR